jgi:hypothetical protein
MSPLLHSLGRYTDEQQCSRKNTGGNVTVKVMLGWMNEDHGTVETSPSGEPLLYAGPDPAYTRELVEMQRR